MIGPAHANRILSGVAGHSSWWFPDSPCASLAARTASLRARWTETAKRRGGSPIPYNNKQRNDIIIQTQSTGLIDCLVFKPYWQFISHITAELLTRPLLPVNGCNRTLLDNLRSVSRDFYRATPFVTGYRVLVGFIRRIPPPIPWLLTTPKSYMWT